MDWNSNGILTDPAYGQDVNFNGGALTTLNAG